MFPKMGEMGLLGLGYLEHTIAMEGEWEADVKAGRS